MDLSRVGGRSGREGLKARHEPYWQQLGTGCHLGFRKSGKSNVETWSARYYDSAKQTSSKYSYRTLGDYSDLPPSERFGAAKKEAEQWWSHLRSGGNARSLTVLDACKSYVVGSGSEEVPERPKAEQWFARLVYSDPIAVIELCDLKKADIEAWRRRITARPAAVTRSKKGKKVTRVRSVSTVNRDMVSLRAALNAAFISGAVATDLAWRGALRANPNAGTRRTLHLDKNQRRLLVAKARADFQPFLQALCAIPVRPGALAAMLVRHFERRTGVMAVPAGADKGKPFRELRLPENTAAFFRDQAKNKAPDALLFTQANGRAWTRDSWNEPIKQAAAAAGLPAETVAYTLRHSVITDMVIAGVPLLTIAQISATSVQMIEQHYGHLKQDHATAALAAIAF